MYVLLTSPPSLSDLNMTSNVATLIRCYVSRGDELDCYFRRVSGLSLAECAVERVSYAISSHVFILQDHPYRHNCPHLIVPL